MVLPTYPWRRQRYWTDVVATQPAGPRLHPLVHRRLASALEQVIFESQLSANSPAYLADHRVFGRVILPASAYLEMALAVGRSVLGREPLTISEVSIQQALVLEDAPCTVQVIITPGERAYHFELFSLAYDEKWIRHASGRMSGGAPRPKHPVASVDLQALQAQYPETVDLETYHQRFTERGMAYGPAFQAIDALYASATEPSAALARVCLPKAAMVPGEGGVYHLHPVLLDACLRVSEALFHDLDADRLYLPFGVTALHVWAALKNTVWVQATGTQQADTDTRVVDLELFDEDGTRVATIDGLQLRAASVAVLQRQDDLARQSSNVLTEWLYELTWQPKSRSESQSEGRSGTWLILADDRGVGARLAEQLEQQNESCLLVFSGSDYQRVAPGRYQLNPTRPSEFEQLLTHALPEAPAGVIHLWGLAAQEGEYASGVASALHLVQALNRTSITVPIWVVTTGAKVVEPVDQGAPSIWQTPLWGLGRVIQAEHPELACICVDLGPQAEELPLLVHALRSHDGENQIAFRQGQRYVARLTRVDGVESEPPRVHSDASYLVTGGLGALGLQMARHLVAEGARHLLLTGRRGVTSAEQQAAIQQLEAEGAQVQVIQADVSNPAEVTKLLARAGLMKPLRGVIHAAGVLDDGMLMQQTPERFEHVAAPKVQGAWHLHTQTLEHPLDFFVLFSSVASLMGSASQANYAAANAFMDGLAHARRASGRPALAINWGPWGDVGMAAAEPVKRRLANEGWDTITSQQGWQITHALLQHDIAQAGVLPIDWATFVQQVPGAAQSPLLSILTEQVKLTAPQLSSTSKGHAIAEQLQTVSPDERQELLVAYIQERTAQTLRVPVAQLDEQESLSQLGIDSLIAVELRTWVRNDLDLDVPVEHFLTTPTISDLAATIGGQLSSVAPGASPTVAFPPSSWVTYPRPHRQAQVRLFCFPYAGGGASIYRDWAEALPSEIELCPIQLPGREERLREALFTDLASLVDALLPILHPHLHKPFAFFGHSMGAVISYEVARQLQKQHDREPIRLLISSRSAPQRSITATPLRFLPAGSFMDELQRLYGAVPEVIRQNAELQNVFLPILRADVTLLETHIHVPGEPLHCPISVFGGTEDPSVTHEALAAWREHTSASFEQHLFPGDHFYLNHAREALTDIITRALLTHT